MEKENIRYQLFCDIIHSFDEGCELTKEYDSLLHDYNGVVMFQAESQLIKTIGNHPGITASDISQLFKTTSSASSQLIRKLREKGWVIQERNENNRRIWNLYLTEEGKKIYQAHYNFESRCYMRTFHSLDHFTEEELETYLKIQKCINETFKIDVKESQQLNIKP